MRIFRLSIPLLVILLSAPASLVLAQSAEVGPKIKIMEPVITSQKNISSPADLEELLKGTQPIPNFNAVNAKRPSLYVTDVNLSRNRARAGENITGNFTIKNGSSFPVRGIKYALYLASKERAENTPRPYYMPKDFTLGPAQSAATVADYSIANEIIDLPAYGTTVREFTYTFPMSLPTDIYIFWVTIQTERGQQFSSNEIILAVDGSINIPLSISDMYFAIKQEDGSTSHIPSRALAQIYLEPNEAVSFLYQVKNTSDAAMDIKPELIISGHSPVGPKIEIYFSNNVLSIEKGEQSLNFSLPKLNPGKYSGFLKFAATSRSDKFSQINNLTLPWISRFSFLVPGENAEITEMIIDQSSQDYNKVDIIAEGPSSLESDLSSIQIKLAVSDADSGEIIREQSETAKLTSWSKESPIVIKTFNVKKPTAQNLIYEASILKGENMLDSYAIKTKNENIPAEEAEGTGNLSVIFFSLIGILIAAGAGWFIYKKIKDSGTINAIPILFLALCLGIYLGLSKTASAATIDNSDGFWGYVMNLASPTYNQIFNPGQELPIRAYFASINRGDFDPNRCRKQDLSGSISVQALFLLTDKELDTGEWTKIYHNYSQISQKYIDEQFPGKNYKFLGRLDGSGVWWRSAGCTVSGRMGINGSKAVPENIPPGTYYFYLISNFGHVMHEAIIVTDLTYSIQTEPQKLTVKPGQTAKYSITIIPQRLSVFIPEEPGFFVHHPPPASLPPLAGDIFEYWDSPKHLSEYKPGDKINFSAGAYIPPPTPGKNPKCIGTASGLSLALALISDELPKDIKKLNLQNIREQFEGANYRTLGTLNSGASAGCSAEGFMWFNQSASGEKTVPKSAAICDANGKLVSIKGRVYAFVIYEGDVGAFTAYQEIVITDNPKPRAKTRESSFKEPITLSQDDFVGVHPSDLNQILRNVLSPDYYDIAFEPSSEATIDAGTTLYKPISLKVTPRQGAPAGVYKFHIQGVSGGNIAGIKKQTPDPYLEIDYNAPPNAPQNLRTGGATCPNIGLRWDPVQFDPNVSGDKGYRLIKLQPTGPQDTIRETVIAELPPDTTSYIDTETKENWFYDYIVEAFDRNGANRSKSLFIRTLFCPNVPDLTVESIKLPSPIYGGVKMPVSAAIKNWGKADFIGEFANRFEIDLNSQEFQNAEINLPSNPLTNLLSLETKEATASWDNPQLGTHTLRVCANTPPNKNVPVVSQIDKHNCLTRNFKVDLKPLTVSCSANISASALALSGQQITWTASPDGGIPPYTYSWSGDDGLTGSGKSITKTYSLPQGPSSQPTPKTARIRATDKDGRVAENTCKITVVKPKICEVNPADPSCK